MTAEQPVVVNLVGPLTDDQVKEYLKRFDDGQSAKDMPVKLRAVLSTAMDAVLRRLAEDTRALETIQRIITTPSGDPLNDTEILKLLIRQLAGT
jgi:hypothetical protein